MTSSALKIERLTETRITEVYEIAQAYARKANYSDEVVSDFPGYAVTKLIENGSIHMNTCFIDFLRFLYGAKHSSRYELSKALKTSCEITEMNESGALCEKMNTVELITFLESVLSDSEFDIVKERVILETPIKKVAEDLSISAARVSQLVKEALMKVKNGL
ncbi:MAG: hypothetical protein HRU19_30940 [Pseudobacteriovorax sp.]|nr:hypothetical protein [Pseudobacteriovorax sp.]